MIWYVIEQPNNEKVYWNQHPEMFLSYYNLFSEIQCTIHTLGRGHSWGLLTYIHNWSLQPFSQDYNLSSHTTGTILSLSAGPLNFESIRTTDFWETFQGNFIFFFFARQTWKIKKKFGSWSFLRINTLMT